MKISLTFVLLLRLYAVFAQSTEQRDTTLAVFKEKIQFYSTNQLNYDSLNKYCDLYIDFSIKNNLNDAILDAYVKKTNTKRRQIDWSGLIAAGQEAIHRIDSLKIPANAYEKSLIIDEMIYGYIFLGDLENAIFYAKSCISALKKENQNGKNDLQIALLYLTSARAFGHLGHLENASEKLDSSLFFINKTTNHLRKHLILNDLASNLIEMKRFDEALPVALKCFEFFEKNPDNLGSNEIQMLLGRIYLGLKEYDKAIKFSKKPIGKIENPRVLYRSYETLYYALKAKKRFAEALFAYEKYHEFHEKIFNERIANEKNALEKRFAEEKSAVLLNKEKIEVENQIRFRNYLIVGAILLSIVSIFLFFNRKILQKQKAEIENQKTTIEELNIDLEKKVGIRTAELQDALNEIKEAMQRGQSLERKRMAADLHDNLGSLLTAINISLDNINPEHLSIREKKIYENIVQMTENAYSEIRILSHNLMPEVLEKEGLVVALEQLVKKLNLNQKIRFSLIINNLSIQDKTISLNLYAICLELIQNIIKHSEATEAEILLAQNSNTIQLEVSDNGKGIGNKKGFGLQNIQSRLEAINGQFLIDEGFKNGLKSVISVSLPTY